MTHLLFTLAGAVPLGITLPLVLELLLVTSANLLPGRLRSMDKKEEIEKKSLELAIVVPAHNEELLVNRCVASLRASASPDVRILVVAHNCSDATAARAAQAGGDALVYNDPTAV